MTVALAAIFLLASLIYASQRAQAAPAKEAAGRIERQFKTTMKITLQTSQTEYLTLLKGDTGWGEWGGAGDF